MHRQPGRISSHGLSWEINLDYVRAHITFDGRTARSSTICALPGLNLRPVS